MDSYLTIGEPLLIPRSARCSGKVLALLVLAMFGGAVLFAASGGNGQRLSDEEPIDTMSVPGFLGRKSVESAQRGFLPVTYGGHGIMDRAGGYDGQYGRWTPPAKGLRGKEGSIPEFAAWKAEVAAAPAAQTMPATAQASPMSNAELRATWKAEAQHASRNGLPFPDFAAWKAVRAAAPVRGAAYSSSTPQNKRAMDAGGYASYAPKFGFVTAPAAQTIPNSVSQAELKSLLQAEPAAATESSKSDSELRATWKAEAQHASRNGVPFPDFATWFARVAAAPVQGAASSYSTPQNKRPMDAGGYASYAPKFGSASAPAAQTIPNSVSQAELKSLMQAEPAAATESSMSDADLRATWKAEAQHASRNGVPFPDFAAWKTFGAAASVGGAAYSYSTPQNKRAMDAGGYASYAPTFGGR